MTTFREDLKKAIKKSKTSYRVTALELEMEKLRQEFQAIHSRLYQIDAALGRLNKEISQATALYHGINKPNP